MHERGTGPKITYSRFPDVSAREEEAALDAVYAYLLALHDRLDHDAAAHAKDDLPGSAAADGDTEALDG